MILQGHTPKQTRSRSTRVIRYLLYVFVIWDISNFIYMQYGGIILFILISVIYDNTRTLSGRIIFVSSDVGLAHWTLGYVHH